MPFYSFSYLFLLNIKLTQLNNSTNLSKVILKPPTSIKTHIVDILIRLSQSHLVEVHFNWSMKNFITLDIIIDKIREVYVAK